MANILNATGQIIAGGLQGIGSAIPGVGQAISGAGQGLSNVLVQDVQRSNMRYQVDLQKELFDYVAEYNSPANQRKRLEDAGYNPALMYGTSQPTINAPGGPSPSPVAMAHGIQPNFTADSQNINYDTDSYLKQMLAGKTNAEVAAIVLRNEILSIEKEQQTIFTDILKATKDDKIFRETLENEKLSAEIFNLGDIGRNMMAQFGLTQAQTNEVIANIALIGEKLLNAQQERNQNAWRYGIEQKLGWLGQPCFQGIVSLGVDVLSSLAGVFKFITNIRNPQKMLQSTFGQRTVFGKSGEPMTITEEKYFNYAP